MLVCRSSSRETWPCDRESGEQQLQGSQEAGGRGQVGTSRDFESKEEGDLSQAMQLQARQRGQRSASDWSQGQHLSFSMHQHTNTCLVLSA